LLQKEEASIQKLCLTTKHITLYTSNIQLTNDKKQWLNPAKTDHKKTGNYMFFIENKFIK